jgi:hypothetical protein
MANAEHLHLLRSGIEVWNQWRAENPEIRPDLSEMNFIEIEADLNKANLSEAILISANLEKANFSRADLDEANLGGANLSGANLSGAILDRANLSGADLTEADLSGAKLRRATLDRAKLIEADLGGADLKGAMLIDTNLERTNLTGCSIYGISAWDLKLEGSKQTDLIISRPEEPIITVDNLEVAQFIYLLLNNEKIRDVIDTITSKVVLILGSFKAERKAILNAIRDELRKRDYLPVLFDFEKPSSRDLTETISTLAHMARFVIADITEAKRIAQELKHIVPSLPSVPVQPLMTSSDYEYALFEHIRRFSSVLEEYEYDDLDDLLAALSDKVIAPAEAKAKELTPPTRL